MHLPAALTPPIMHRKQLPRFVFTDEEWAAIGHRLSSPKKGVKQPGGGARGSSCRAFFFLWFVLIVHGFGFPPPHENHLAARGGYRTHTATQNGHPKVLDCVVVVFEFELFGIPAVFCVCGGGRRFA